MSEQPNNYTENEISLEEAEALSKKVSLLMTKPENTDSEVPFLLLLKNKGFNAKPFKFTFNEEMLKALYPDMNNWSELVQKATENHLLGKEVEFFLISSDNGEERNVTEEIVELRGKGLKPNDNPEGTLRKEFPGATLNYTDEVGKNVEYFENGFHCPRNAVELISNLKAFGLLGKAKELAM